MPDTELERITSLEINPPKPTGPVALAPAMPAIPAIPAAPKDIRYLCRHIFTDGRRCGSPALKTQNFCYYHYTHRAHLYHNKCDRSRKTRFELECFDGLDNPTSVQLALTEVATRLASGTIDPKRAGLLLYALQIAGQNLRNTKTAENSVPVPAVVEDPTFGHLAELEPGRTEPETLMSRLSAPRPFTGYDPPYEIPADLQELLDRKEQPKLQPNSNPD